MVQGRGGLGRARDAAVVARMSGRVALTERFAKGATTEVLGLECECSLTYLERVFASSESRSARRFRFHSRASSAAFDQVGF